MLDPHLPESLLLPDNFRFLPERTKALDPRIQPPRHPAPRLPDPAPRLPDPAPRLPAIPGSLSSTRRRLTLGSLLLLALGLLTYWLFRP